MSERETQRIGRICFKRGEALCIALRGGISSFTGAVSCSISAHSQLPVQFVPSLSALIFQRSPLFASIMTLCFPDQKTPKLLSNLKRPFNSPIPVFSSSFYNPLPPIHPPIYPSIHPPIYPPSTFITAGFLSTKHPAPVRVSMPSRRQMHSASYEPQSMPILPLQKVSRCRNVPRL